MDGCGNVIGRLRGARHSVNFRQLLVVVQFEFWTAVQRLGVARRFDRAAIRRTTQIMGRAASINATKPCDTSTNCPRSLICKIITPPFHENRRWSAGSVGDAHDCIPSKYREYPAGGSQYGWSRFARQKHNFPTREATVEDRRGKIPRKNPRQAAGYMGLGCRSKIGQAVAPGMNIGARAASLADSPVPIVPRSTNSPASQSVVGRPDVADSLRS